MELVRMIEPAPRSMRCGAVARHVAHTPGQVDVEHCLPSVLAEINDQSARRDPRRRADDVEAGQLLDTAVGRGLHGVSVTDVNDLAKDPSTRLGDQPDRLVEIGQRGGRYDDGVDSTADIERDDVGTLLREAHRLRTPDAPCRTGDQCDLSLQPAAHHAFPSRPASTTSWVPVM
jgi:hypothetical protein